MKKNITRVPFEFWHEVRVAVGNTIYEFGRVLVSGFAKKKGKVVYGDIDRVHEETSEVKGKLEVLGAMDQIEEAADHHARQLIPA